MTTHDFNDPDAVCELNDLSFVRRRAAQIVQEINADVDDDFAGEAFDQSVDAAINSHWLCSTYKAQSLLLWSKNKNAIFDLDAEWMRNAESIQELSERAARIAMATDIYNEVMATLNDPVAED